MGCNYSRFPWACAFCYMQYSIPQHPQKSNAGRIKTCLCFHVGVSIPVDGGGLLTSWFNLDLQPIIAANGEDVIFSNGSSANAAPSNGQETGMKEGMAHPAEASRQAVKASAQCYRQTRSCVKPRQQLRAPVSVRTSVRQLGGAQFPCARLA